VLKLCKDLKLACASATGACQASKPASTTPAKPRPGTTETTFIATPPNIEHTAVRWRTGRITWVKAFVLQVARRPCANSLRKLTHHKGGLAAQATS